MSDPHPKLTAAMRQSGKLSKSVLGYFPRAFMEMLSDRHGYETAKALVQAPSPSDGFLKLAEMGRLDFAVEALVLQPEWSSLFSPEILNSAQKRLINYGYNISELFPLPNTVFSSDEAPLPAGRTSVTVDRIFRDSPLTTRVKNLHDHECQLCGLAILLPGNRIYAEAHHIRPLGGEHRGPDISGNLLCVCPNCHVKLDFIAIRLDAVSLTIKDGHALDQQYIDYHNERYEAAHAAEG